MKKKLTYEELENRVRELEKEALERKRAEEVCRESEEKCRTLINASHDMIFKVDLEGAFLFANEAFEDILGYSFEEIVKINGFDLVHPEDLRTVKERFAPLIEGKRADNMEYRYRTKSGSYINIITNAAPLFDSQGNVVAALGIAKDITELKLAEEALRKASDDLQEQVEKRTAELASANEQLRQEIEERKRTEQALRESEEQYKALVESSIDGIVVIQNDEIVFVNKTMLEMFGCEGMDEMLGHIFTEFVSPECRDLMQGRGLDREEGVDVPGRYEFKALRRDGTQFEAELSVGAIRYQGGMARQVVVRNVTEQKRAKEALTASEKQYRDLVDNAMVGIYRTTIDGDVLYVNKALSTMLKYGSPTEAMSASSLTRYKAPRDREVLVERLKKSGAVDNFEVELLTTTGETKNVLLSAVMDQDAITGMIMDITEQKTAEAALRESEAQKRAILDASVDMIMQVDTEMRIVWANKKAATVVNKGPEDLIGHTCHKFFQNADAPCPGCPCKKALETGSIEHGIMYQPAMDTVGESYWEDYGVPLKDESGRVTGVIEIARNVTEKVKAEQALVEAKEDWEKTFDAINDMVMLLDTDHRIRQVNRSMAETFHESKERLVGKKCYEVVHQQSRPISSCPLLVTMKTLKPYTAEITEPRMDKTFICSTSPVLDHEEKLTGYTHSLKDITESRHLEAQLLRATKLEAIGTLAGGIAHDINNVLMGIQGYTSLMLLHTGSAHPHFRNLKGIEHWVENGANLTRQLLGFARGGKYEVKVTDLNELVEKSSEMFGRTKKEIRIHRNYQQDTWQVEVDPGQIEQVLLNLYVNAWHAMPGGGDLYIETGNVVLGESESRAFDVEPGGYVKISVTDTGTGMDEATRRRIFDPFFTTKEMGRGTGLGLASAYGIIRNHGGIINVCSEKGKGTTFSIYLPATRKEFATEDRGVDYEVLRGTETVLLVDDEKMILQVAKRMLEKLGYVVLAADSGEQAVEVYEQHKDEIDLVILDMIMPDMSGGDTYDKMKEIKQKQKVLLASGYAANGQAASIMTRGCNGFIQKPFSIKKLSAAIRGILDNK
jgi:two-component system cell cycle sensor histidine kinase/response regulator CckA